MTWLEFEATRVTLPYEGRCSAAFSIKTKGTRAEHAPEKQRIIFLLLIRFISKGFHMECVMCIRNANTLSRYFYASVREILALYTFACLRVHCLVI